MINYTYMKILLRTGVFIGGTYGCWQVASITLPQQTVYDVKGTAKSVGNFAYALYMSAAIGIDYTWGLRGIEFPSDEYYEKRREIHTRCAKRILRLSVANKGIYLKFGQYIGNLERIAPKEYTEVLKVLQDSGPQVDFNSVNTVFKADFGQDIHDIFELFDEKAIAAASLAQVHSAIYKGEKVAVKIQFPTLRVQFDQDTRLMEVIVKMADAVLRFYRYKDMNLHKVFTTFQASLREELDFRVEMKNGEKTKEIFKGIDDVFVPSYYKEYSGVRVLTMDFVEGVRINQREKIEEMGFKSTHVADMLIQTFGRMIFMYGHVHCDAHPGNILVRPNPLNKRKPQIVLLDHGFYRTYDDEFLKKYCRLWKSLIEQDYETMKEISDSFGVGEYYKYLPLVLLWRSKNTKKLGEMIPESDRKNLQKQELVTFEIINYIMQKIPEHMIFIIRASNLVAIHNLSLGGTMRNRFMRFTESCYRNLYPNYFSFRLQMFWLRIKLIVMENFIAIYRMIYPTNVEVL